jgi:hypothetical protein
MPETDLIDFIGTFTGSLCHGKSSENGICNALYISFHIYKYIIHVIFVAVISIMNPFICEYH